MSALKPRPLVGVVALMALAPFLEGQVATAAGGQTAQGAAQTDAVGRGEPREERASAPLVLPTGFDFRRLRQQVLLAYRPDGDGYSGGSSSYRVQVDGTGRWFVRPVRGASGANPGLANGPMGAGLHVATVAIETAEAPSAAPAPTVVTTIDGSLEIWRGPAVERLRNTPAGIEQSWAFERRPEGRRDLVVRVRVAGQSYSGETAKGLHFLDSGTGLGLRYGLATWVDSAGRRSPVRPRYVDGEIVMVVPAAVIASSGFPAVLDPVLSPEQGTDDPVISPVVGGTMSPAIVWDGTNYLVVWSDCRDPFAGSTCGIWGARVGASSGALLDPTGFPIAYGDGNTNFFNLGGAQNQGLACDQTYCLVTWQGPGLMGRFVTIASPSTPGPEFQINNSGDNWEGGTVAYASASNTYLVAYSLLGPSFNPVVGNIVHPNNPTPDPQFTIEQSCSSSTVSPRAQSCASQHRNPVVASDGASFFVAWDEQDFNTGAFQWATYVFGRGVSGAGVPQGVATSVTPITEGWNHQGLFTQPGLAWDGSGNYVVAWDDTRACPGTPPLSPCSDTRIYTRLVSAAFVPAAAELGVTTDGPVHESLPTLSRSGAGNLLVTWDDGRGGIWGQLITSGPLALNGGNFSVAAGGSSSVASDGSSYAVASSNNAQAYVAGVTSGGGSQFASERVSSAANSQYSPALAFGQTDFLAVWSDSRNSPSQNSIYAARIDPTGTVLDSTGIAVSTTSNESSPAVAFAPGSASYLAVWTTGLGVSARRVNPDGSMVSAEQAIPVSGSSPSVASDGTNFLIVDSVPQSDSPGAISAALVGPEGTTITGVPISTTTAPDAQTAVAYGLDSLGTGRYLVAWGEGSDIRGQLVTTGGTPLNGSTGFVISNAIGLQSQPSVAFDGTNFVVVWSDARGATRDIYGARVNDAGTVLDASGVLLSPVNGLDKQSPRVTFDGMQTTVVWQEPQTNDLVASLVTPDLASVLDLLVVTDGTTSPPALASDGRGLTLIGDTHFDTASDVQSSRVRLRFLRNALASTTSLASSLNPSSFGAPVTFTATVSAGTTTPGGSVQFRADGAVLGGPVGLSGGVASVTSTSLSVGAHVVTAEYGGTTDFLPSTGTLSPNQTVNPAAATISLGNLSQLYDGSPKPAIATTNPPGLRVLSLTYDGSAVAPTNAGSYAVVASLDNPDYTAPDALGTLVIAPAGTATAVASSLNPATLGQAVTFTATVSSSGGTPTGTVVFKDGTAILGSQAPVAGSASLTTATLAVGAHLITAVYDGAANFAGSTSAVLTQSVGYAFSGFFAPVDNLPTMNAVKAGSAVAVKFSLGGNQELDVLAPGYPASGALACDSTALVNAIEETTTAGSSGLTYDPASGQYVYVWKTDKTWAGTCRQLVVRLKDNTEHRANFKLK